MGNSEKNEGNNSGTFHKRAKAFDGYLGKSADFINGGGSSRSSHVRFDGATEKSSTPDSVTKDQIASCREAYTNVGIIGNIVDLMVDFACEGIDIYHKSPQIQNFFRQWANKVNLTALSEQVLKGVYRDGNVPILAYWGKISESEIKNLKRSTGKAQSDLFSQRVKSEDKIIPYKYQVMDVLNVHKCGSSMIGTEHWEYQFDMEDYQILCAGNLDAKTRDKINSLKESLGPEAFEKLKGAGRMELDSDRFEMIYYKKDGYKSWATPMLWRVMDDIKFKKILRDMDISLAEGVTNALTIVKMGDTVNGYVPSAKKYEKFVAMLKNPSKAKTIVWDDLIDVQTVYPPVDKFLSADKYQQVDDDIRSGLGIAEILVNGGGGNYSSSFLSVKTLLERLELGRRQLLEFLDRQVKLVAGNMGFRSAPVIRMDKMSLNDQQVEKQFILELYDRNMLSMESVTDRFGENFDIELQRIKNEDKTREKIKDDSPFGLLRVGKFGPQYPAGPPELHEFADGPTPDEDNMSNLPSAQEDNGKDGGRKAGEPQKRKKREEPASPVGQTVSNIDTDEVFEALYKQVSSSHCDMSGYADARSFTAEDMEKVLGEVINAIPEVLVQVTEIKAPGEFVAKLNASIEDSTDGFISVNGKRPGKTNTKEIVKKAFATIYNKK